MQRPATHTRALEQQELVLWPPMSPWADQWVHQAFPDLPGMIYKQPPISVKDPGHSEKGCGGEEDTQALECDSSGL
jgi:hypothetical protein